MVSKRQDCRLRRGLLVGGQGEQVVKESKTLKTLD